MLEFYGFYFIQFLTYTGACFPVFAKRHRGLGVPDWAFFIAKYFGSGVIIATAFIHVSYRLSSRVSNNDLPDPSCLLLPTRLSATNAWAESSRSIRGQKPSR